ncbi:MAG: lipopolysaccharide heptosyltransferase I [Gammaproteobacteria bacterium]|nr:lipopolysaccharide heptosyltransferase I [Gammaproteobacteria bacterium]
MRVLIIKTSSLGDVIHALPALTDAHKNLSDIQFDWVIEEAFSEIPVLHPAVDQVIPINLRQWRKQPWQAWRSGAWRNFKDIVQKHYYDHIIDAQGLIKSAFIAYQAHGLRSGLDRDSAREPLASRSYQRRYAIRKDQHAVTRVRRLFAAALGYAMPSGLPDYGINRYAMTTLMPSKPTLIFLHGTAWASKQWPESGWIGLAKRAAAAGYRVRIPWGNATERARAEKIAAVHSLVSVMPSTNLQGIAAELSTARAAVGVDTGLAHLAAALAVPSVTVYGPTNPALTGTYGQDQVHLRTEFSCAPCLQRRCRYKGESPVLPACYQDIPINRVWTKLTELIVNG